MGWLGLNLKKRQEVTLETSDGEIKICWDKKKNAIKLYFKAPDTVRIAREYVEKEEG